MPTKTIKLEEDTYHQLDQLRRKRETFSEAVKRLILLREGMLGLSSVLGGFKAYAEYEERVTHGKEADH